MDDITQCDYCGQARFPIHTCMFGCDTCGAVVHGTDAELHMNYHKMMVESFVGFVDLIKKIAPGLELEIERPGEGQKE